MPVVISNNATTIWDCESVTGAVGNKPALETEIIKENVTSVDFTTTQTTTECAFDGTIPDLTGQHLRIWYTSITFPNMSSANNGGVSFYATDGTNTAYWSLGGKDTYSGGWLNALIYIDSIPDSGTVNSATITEMGIIHMNGFADSSYATRPKNQINAWIDYLRYGDGLVAYGSPSFGINLLAAADQSAGAGYGVIETNNETHFIYGSLEYGRTTEQTIYTDSTELMIFANANVSTTLYGIRFVGDTLVTSTFNMDGNVISSAGERFYIDFKDNNINDLTFIRNTVSGANIIEFLNDNIKADISLNSFSDCNQIKVNDSKFQNNNINLSGLITVGDNSIFTDNVISDSVGSISLSVLSLDTIYNCTFKSNGSNHAIDLGTITSSQSMGWNSYSINYAGIDGSTGNETILVSVDNGIILTINVGAGYSTPSIYNTGLGTVNVVSGQVTLTIKVVDINTGLPIVDLARVYILTSTGGSLPEDTIIIDRVLTDVNGQVSDTRSYSTDQPITGWVRKGTDPPYYKTAPIAGTIDSASGLSLTIQMIPDE